MIPKIFYLFNAPPPPQYPQNLHTPKNIPFSEPPLNIEIQNFKPPKMIRALVYMKISE